MATEEGVVVSVGKKTAKIKTVRSSACKSCSARNSCNSSGGSEEMEVAAINQAMAAVGDRVLIGFESNALYKATFLLYLFPILALMAGAFAGQALAPLLAMGESAAAALGGFFCFVTAFILVRRTGNRMATKEAYQPKIIRVISSPPKRTGRGPGDISSDVSETQP